MLILQPLSQAVQGENIMSKAGSVQAGRRIEEKIAAQDQKTRGGTQDKN